MSSEIRTPNMLSWASAVVWPLMSILPILLSTEELPTHYSNVFPEEWYKVDNNNMERETVFEDGTIGTESAEHMNMNNTPKPLGLILGILAVFIGHVFLLPIFYVYRQGYLSTDGKTKPQSIQSSGARDYHFGEGLQTHLSQPEGFVLLGLYLTFTWMLNLMPQSYYSFEGTIQWGRVFLCLAAQDGLQYAMHRLEHRVSPEFYKLSHKPHHRFTNPRLFDAFNGSVPDTVLMILLPLFATANIVRDCNVWTYMAFGSMYANWLVLIHSEYVFPWDGVFRSLGLGTPADHHVHHKLFKYNYGHLFLWFDQIGGTYRDPQNYAPKIFNVGV